MQVCMSVCVLHQLRERVKECKKKRTNLLMEQLSLRSNQDSQRRHSSFNYISTLPCYNVSDKLLKPDGSTLRSHVSLSFFFIGKCSWSLEDLNYSMSGVKRNHVANAIENWGEFKKKKSLLHYSSRHALIKQLCSSFAQLKDPNASLNG